MTPDELRYALNWRIASHGLTVNGWCRKSGVPEHSLRAFLAGRAETVTVLTLSRLARGLGLPLSELTKPPAVPEGAVAPWMPVPGDRLAFLEAVEREARLYMAETRFPERVMSGIRLHRLLGTREAAELDEAERRCAPAA